MKRLVTFYFLILLPVPVFYWLGKHNYNMEFTITILAYASIYRTITDGVKLAQMGLIKRNEIWKLLLPFSRAKYFKELYFQ